jgi:hypothetical protein
VVLKLKSKETASMTFSKNPQQGASAIGILIILALVGAGVYFAIQYVPQYIESAKLDSILATLEKTHGEAPYASRQELESAIEKQLDINEVRELKDTFTVTPEGRGYRVDVRYDRELNLLFGNKPIAYEKTLIIQ